MRLTLAALALTLAGTAVVSQETDTMAATDHSAHSNMDANSPMGGMMAAMDAMMAATPTESTGNPDADFLLMMIPHHQSAIDMARVELEHGADEATRAMAQEIIDAQEAEIAEMRSMLETMGVEAPTAPAE